MHFYKAENKLNYLYLALYKQAVVTHHILKGIHNF